MKGKRLLSLVLSLAMLLMCMPLSVYAAGGEAVIDTVKYNGTEFKPDDKNIVLKVPNSFSGNIDLASVLSITYVKENYKYYAPLLIDTLSMILPMRMILFVNPCL